MVKSEGVRKNQLKCQENLADRLSLCLVIYLLQCSLTHWMQSVGIHLPLDNYFCLPFCYLFVTIWQLFCTLGDTFPIWVSEGRGLWVVSTDVKSAVTLSATVALHFFLLCVCQAVNTIAESWSKCRKQRCSATEGHQMVLSKLSVCTEFIKQQIF